jgi:hypothetical protein
VLLVQAVPVALQVTQVILVVQVMQELMVLPVQVVQGAWLGRLAV